MIVDNTALGPTIGGVRMAADASFEECFRPDRGIVRHGCPSVQMLGPLAGPRSTITVMNSRLSGNAAARPDYRI